MMSIGVPICVAAIDMIDDTKGGKAQKFSFKDYIGVSLRFPVAISFANPGSLGAFH
jgi:hypothetical protein